MSSVPFRFVHPRWMLDSLEQNKLLPYEQYRLEGDPTRSAAPFFQPLSHTPEKSDASQRPATTSDLAAPAISRAPPQQLITVASEHSVLQANQPIPQRVNFRRDVPGNPLSAAENPNFLRDYLGNSRLHHLSSWRSKFQEHLVQLLNAKNSEHPVAAAPGRDRIVAHVDMDAFFVTVSLLAFPQHVNSPCVVAYGGDHSDVSSCNYVARKAGVRNGMWLRQANDLCPNLVVLPYMFDKYEEVSKKVCWLSNVIFLTHLFSYLACLYNTRTLLR